MLSRLQTKVFSKMWQHRYFWKKLCHTNSLFVFVYFRMEMDLRVAMLCAATVVTPPQKNAGWNAVNVNFTGVASYSAKNVIGKLK